MRRLAIVLLLATLCVPRTIFADPATQPSLFDPNRHMHVSEVRPGMKGYGLSVFAGTKIEKFDVEGRNGSHSGAR